MELHGGEENLDVPMQKLDVETMYLLSGLCTSIRAMNNCLWYDLRLYIVQTVYVQ